MNDEGCTSAFEVALKMPGNEAYVFMGDPETSYTKVNIDEWIQRQFSRCSWDGWYMYNDSPPAQKLQYDSDGHCKGILVWNETYVGWLVHTVSDWPVEMPIERVPSHILDESHSFAFWMGKRSNLKRIEQQIDLMGARVYAGKRSEILHKLHAGTLQRIKLDTWTDHIAKNRMWGRDVYQSLGKCHAVSRSSLDDTRQVQNVPRVNLPGWDACTDFGRWAVGDTWVAVGDIRRGKRDFTVGGGALIRYDPVLAAHLLEIIKN
jgi:hypothetical protein